MHPTKLEIIYPVNIRLQTDRANSIQIINTCHALASLGVKVHLCLKKVEGRSPKDCLAFYGLPLAKELHIHCLSVLNPRWGLNLRQKSFFAMSILRLLTLRIESESKVIYLRDLGLAYYLLKLRRLLQNFIPIDTSPMKIFYEVHLVSYLMMKHHHELMSTEHAPSENKIKRTMRQERYVFQNADGLITITAHLKEILKSEFNTQVPIAIIPDGVRTPTRQPPLRRQFHENSLTCTLTHPLQGGGSKRLKKIYYVGQVYPWKGVDVLIRAMEHVEGAELIVVGGLPYERDLSSMKSLARNLKVDHKVNFLGFVPPREVSTMLKGADVAVVPLPSNIMSDSFTSPLKLFEYMAAGVPIVATKLPSLQEVLKDSENAVLVEPGNPIALADGIMKILNCRELADSISARAFEDVHSYTWEARARKIRDFILETIES